MILENYKFTENNSISGRRTDYNITKIKSYKLILFKSNSEYGKIHIFNNCFYGENVIYCNNKKYYMFSDNSFKIKYLCEYDSDYSTILYYKFFKTSLEKEYHKASKDKNLMRIYDIFLDYIHDIEMRIVEHGIE